MGSGQQEGEESGHHGVGTAGGRRNGTPWGRDSRREKNRDTMGSEAKMRPGIADGSRSRKLGSEKCE